MQYRVPQNIDMADKIVGPLTIVQFLYVAIGGAILYLLITKTNWIIFALVGIPTGLFFLALAFYKPQDQPFTHFLSALINYFTKPRDRIWRKGSVDEAVILPHREKVVARPIEKKNISKSELEKLVQVIDSGGWKSLENINTYHTTKGEMAVQQKAAEEAVGAKMAQVAHGENTPVVGQQPSPVRTPVQNQTTITIKEQ